MLYNRRITFSLMSFILFSECWTPRHCGESSPNFSIFEVGEESKVQQRMRETKKEAAKPTKPAADEEKVRACEQCECSAAAGKQLGPANSRAAAS